MTDTEARQLVSDLIAAFPRGEWGKATLDSYIAELRELDREVGNQAIKRTKRTCKYPHPQLAEILEHASYVDPRIAEREARQLEGRPSSGAYRCVNQDEVDALKAGKLLPGPRPTTAAGAQRVFERQLASVPVMAIPEPPRESEIQAEADRNRHRFREWCRANGEPVPGEQP